LRTLSLCTRANSGTVFGKVAYCSSSSNKLYSGVCGAGGEPDCSFRAYPYGHWAKESNPDNISHHYYADFKDRWIYGSQWSGYPISVRCVVALKQKCVLQMRTLALCTWADSGAMFGQVAYCHQSSTEVYSGICGAGGETGCGFSAFPHHIWAKEAYGTSYHHTGLLYADWEYGYRWSGFPFSVRCVVALDGNNCEYGRLPCVQAEAAALCLVR